MGSLRVQATTKESVLVEFPLKSRSSKNKLFTTKLVQPKRYEFQELGKCDRSGPERTTHGKMGVLTPYGLGQTMLKSILRVQANIFMDDCNLCFTWAWNHLKLPIYGLLGAGGKRDTRDPRWTLGRRTDALRQPVFPPGRCNSKAGTTGLGSN